MYHKPQFLPLLLQHVHVSEYLATEGYWKGYSNIVYTFLHNVLLHVQIHNMHTLMDHERCHGRSYNSLFGTIILLTKIRSATDTTQHPPYPLAKTGAMFHSNGLRITQRTDKAALYEC
jgi:hypothetical protein